MKYMLVVGIVSIYCTFVLDLSATFPHSSLSVFPPLSFHHSKLLLRSVKQSDSEMLSTLPEKLYL